MSARSRNLFDTNGNGPFGVRISGEQSITIRIRYSISFGNPSIRSTSSFFFYFFFSCCCSDGEYLCLRKLKLCRINVYSERIRMVVVYSLFCYIHEEWNKFAGFFLSLFGGVIGRGIRQTGLLHFWHGWQWRPTIPSDNMDLNSMEIVYLSMVLELLGTSVFALETSWSKKWFTIHNTYKLYSIFDPFKL